MGMLRLLNLSVLLLLLATVTKAQRLTVTDFHDDPLDNAAVKFEKKDANHESCALVIVQIALAEVTFEGDIVATEQKDGDYWVYMNNGATWLEIKAKGYLSPKFDIKDKFPKGLTGKVTYRVTVEKPDTGDAPKGTLQIMSNVDEADFYVDGTKMSSGRPPFTYNGGEGKHRVTIKAAGYNDESADFEIKLGQTLSHRLDLKAEGSISVDGISYEMVRIEKGSFQMGSKAKDNALSTFSMSKPAHQVTLKGYAIGKTEVTQALWEKVMGSNPSENKSPGKPVENVTWEDCQEFIKSLNQMCGTNFRLPTEAEWEYAATCRNGNNADTYSGDGELRRVANTGGKTIDCGSLAPNALGLHDMTGNVAEWCQDYIVRYSTESRVNPCNDDKGFQRVVRGGSCKDSEHFLRSSHRGHMRQDDSSPMVGLRLAQDI